MSGLYFEQLDPGLVIEHPVTRTVTETDNLLFTTLTLNVQPLHLDAEFAKNSMYGERIVNSVFTLGVVVGIPVQETTLGTTLGNLGFEEIAFPASVSSVTRCGWRPRSCRVASPSRGPTPGSCASSIAASTRTANWSAECAAPA